MFFLDRWSLFKGGFNTGFTILIKASTLLPEEHELCNGTVVCLETEFLSIRG